MAEGRLFYLMGASGCGKDSLMRYARSLLDGNPGVQFAHRYITRSPDSRGENHIALSDAEFKARQEAGLFGMHWESHGHRYGIGREIDLWRAQGCSVVVNGSRAYLATALNLYRNLRPILVEAPLEVLEERLRRRGRESGEQLTARLQRASLFRLSVPGLIILENGGPIEVAGRRFAALLAENSAGVQPACPPGKAPLACHSAHGANGYPGFTNPEPAPMLRVSANSLAGDNLVLGAQTCMRDG